MGVHSDLMGFQGDLLLIYWEFMGKKVGFLPEWPSNHREFMMIAHGGPTLPPNIQHPDPPPGETIHGFWGILRYCDPFQMCLILGESEHVRMENHVLKSC